MEATPNSVQDRINRKAEERFQQDLQNATDALRTNPILAGLKIKFGEKKVSLFEFGNYGVFGAHLSRNAAIETRVAIENTNLAELKSELIGNYIQQETDALFSKLEAITEYFQTKED